MTTIAIYGAAGSMGTKAYKALDQDPDCAVLYVESGDKGEDLLRERGLEPTGCEAAAEQADVVILAVPDTLIGDLSHQIVPLMKRGSMLMGLDPAAAYAGRLPDREDITHFVTHPAHPPIFNDEEDPELRRDFFGGQARQTIVNALVQGPEEDYARGEQIAQKLFGPILRSHRVSIEQMAILEPVLTETVCATCLTIVREAMDEAIDRGVPAEAARDFLMGHLNVELAILFDEIEWDFSQGAKDAIAEAKSQLFRSDWKKVFEPEELLKSTRQITEGPNA
jgi:hypothetical protein